MNKFKQKKVYGIVEYEWGQLHTFEVYSTQKLAKTELNKIPPKDRKIWYVQELDLIEGNKI